MPTKQPKTTLADDAKTSARKSRGPSAASSSAKPAALIKAPAKPAPKPSKGKVAELIALLRREGGATIEVMMATTGWQAHSVRGAISGAVKKKLGLTVTTEKSAAGTTYRIAPETAE